MLVLWPGSVAGSPLATALPLGKLRWSWWLKKRRPLEAIPIDVPHWKGRNGEGAGLLGTGGRMGR